MATIQHSVPAAPSIAGERLPKGAIVGYGLGDFANNLAFTLGTTFLLYYYTDVAGMSAAAVATMFFVVRLWDAVTDIFAGRLVDRTMTRLGKFRPFILFGGVPLLFLTDWYWGVGAIVAGIAVTIPSALVPATIALAFATGVSHPLRAAAIQRMTSDNMRARAASAANACDMAFSTVVLLLAGNLLAGRP